MTKILTANNKYDWINTIVSVHNLVCPCTKPLNHTIEEILRQEPNLKVHIPERCHSGTAEATTPAADEFLGEGDLEDLFKQDFDEKDTATDVATG